MNEWTNNKIEKGQRPSQRKIFLVIHVWFFRNKYIPTDLLLWNGCRKAQWSFRCSSEPTQKCPVKKYFNLFWKETFCLQRNHPPNIRQVYIISFSLFSSIRPPGIILGQLFPSSLLEFQSQDVLSPLFLRTFLTWPSFKPSIPSGCSAIGERPWKSCLACDQIEMSTWSLNTQYLLARDSGKDQAARGMPVCDPTMAQTSPKEDNL